jgi:hypothetical protein
MTNLSKKEIYIERIKKEYEQSKKDLESSYFKEVKLELKFKEKDSIFITDRSSDLLARFHAINSVAIFDFIPKQGRTLSYLISNKKLELLQLMIQDNWISEEYISLSNFNVTFEYSFTFDLTGTRVSDFHKILDLQRAISILKGHMTIDLRRSKKYVLGAFIVDACKLWTHALMNLHPNLEIWKDITPILIPVDTETWPAKMPEIKENIPFDKLKGDKARTFLEQIFHINMREYHRLKAEGLSDFEIIEQFKPKGKIR